MDILEVIRNRRSDRHFDGRAVAQPDIDLLIEAFRWAPSCTNRQPWRLIFATNAESRAAYDDALSAGNKQWACAAPVKIVVIGTPEEQPDRNGLQSWMLDAGLVCLDAVASYVGESIGAPRDELLAVVLPGALVEHDLLKHSTD